RRASPRRCAGARRRRSAHRRSSRRPPSPQGPGHPRRRRPAAASGARPGAGRRGRGGGPGRRCRGSCGSVWHGCPVSLLQVPCQLQAVDLKGFLHGAPVSGASAGQPGGHRPGADGRTLVAGTPGEWPCARQGARQGWMAGRRAPPFRRRVPPVGPYAPVESRACYPWEDGMCGIVGAIADRDVVPVLIEGLKRLEYRGYDSAGLAVVETGGIRRVRRTGRVAEMEHAAAAEDFHGVLGIGHTRWATHGGVTEANAHPHVSHGELALVHNGIIENHEEQRERLRGLGYQFESQTDTEVIAHLIHYYMQQGQDLLGALQHAVKELSGAYALAVVSLREPGRLVGARMGCPLLVGVGEGENFLASDVSAIISATRRVIFLEEGDTADIRREGVRVFDSADQEVAREVHVSDVSLASLELGPYRHFMQKEIHEQPRAIADTVEAVIDAGSFEPTLFGANAEEVLRKVRGVQILACGTSYYAGLTARYWIEAVAGLPCSVEIASEYRYRDAYADPDYLVVTISQSGETLDTMEALKYARSLGHRHTLSICNVPES